MADKRMFLGLVVAGIAVGTVVASMWIASGGSLLIGVVLYSLVAALVILEMTALSHLVSKWWEADETGKGNAQAQTPAE